MFRVRSQFNKCGVKNSPLSKMFKTLLVKCDFLTQSMSQFGSSCEIAMRHNEMIISLITSVCNHNNNNNDTGCQNDRDAPVQEIL